MEASCGQSEEEDDINHGMLTLHGISVAEFSLPWSYTLSNPSTLMMQVVPGEVGNFHNKATHATD